MENVTSLKNHWWSRPGWRPGRIMLTWHLTFEHAAALHQLVGAYQRALDGLPGLNMVPTQWLHLTIQGVGYTDEISNAALGAATQSVRQRLAALAPFELTFTRPIILGEAIAIPPSPPEPLQQLLSTIRDGIADAVGEDAVRTGPEQVEGFHPHVSIAYSQIDDDAKPYQAALDSINPPPAVAPVDTVTLIRQDRQLEPHWLYRWTTEATATLRG